MITVITNGRVLDCIGDEPLEDASVVIEKGIIKDIYLGEKSIPQGAMVIDAVGRTVLPGLIDAHEHTALTDVDVSKHYAKPPLFAALDMKNNLERTLQAGFTTVRDMGGSFWALKQAIEDGLIKGPRLLISGAWLSQTGGHGDHNVYGEMVSTPTSSTFPLSRICDGVDDCRRAAREQLRAGADHLKICGATGGCLSPNDQPWQQQFSNDEMRAIVEEAEAVGTYVGTHCLNDKGIRRSLECGVTSIEHGLFMTEETACMIKEKGAFLVPTPAPAWWIIKHGRQSGAAQHFIEKVTPLYEAGLHAIQVARRIGVTIGSGSDMFGQMCGEEGIQIKILVEAGMTPYEAIKSTTIVNADSVLRMRDKIGSIEVGKWADIVIVDGNPDEDVNILTEPSNVRFVMKKEEIFKNTI
ncbi:amidohydrolase family protein [Chloroflexota bacterium]